MLRIRDTRALLRTLKAQFPLMLAFVQIVDAGHKLRACEWQPVGTVKRSIVRGNLNAVCR